MSPFWTALATPAGPRLVVLAFKDVDLGERHGDLLSCRHRRTTAELLMTFPMSVDASRFQ